ncbi:MAG: hypothetical protein GY871_05340 [Actinomycetales bacterium]|nr:hypothetical protein [Actinomycetales bacterium]
MRLVRNIVAVFLACTTSMSVLAQSQGRTIDDPASAITDATRRLLELCQNPDASPEEVGAAIRDGADPKAVIEVPTRIPILGNRERMVRRTALQVAAMTVRDPKVIRLMIDAGSKPTPKLIQLAVNHNPNPEVIVALLDSWTRVPNARDLNGIRLFSEACESNESVEVIRWFLETQRSNLNASDEDVNAGMTPFQTACGSNLNPEVIRLLVDNGGILKATRRGGISPLMFAAMSNTPEITEVLIESGSEVNDRTHKGMSAYLYAALSSRYPGTFQLLVEHGADPNAVEYGVNAIEMSAAINENPGIMAAIIAAGTRLPPLTSDGESVLSWACGNPNPSVTEALLEAGVDPNPKDAEPPLLSFASLNVNPEVIQVLLGAGADVNARSIRVIPGMLEFKPFFLPGTTPLMLASDNISTEDIVPFISVLLDGGANANDANEGGYTPLMFAANKRYKTGSTAEVIRLLIQAGADPNARNESGLTARDIAEANPKLAEIDLDAAFQSLGADSAPAGER